MIFEAVISVFVGLIVFIGELMPDMTTPGWVDTIGTNLSTITGQMAALGAWIPFGAAGNATLLVLAALGVSIAVRLVRIVLSLFTGGGGGAA